MKKIANRVLALIAALTVLLMPAALAAEQNTAVLSVGNFELVMGEETISLPVTLQLGGGADLTGARGMALIQLLVGDQTAGTVYGALENEEIKVYIDGMDYGLYVPLADAMAMVEAEMGSAMAEMEEIVTPELEAALTDFIAAVSALEAAEAEISDEAVLSALGIAITGAGIEEIEAFGETITANKSTFTFAPQTVQQMNDSMCAVSPAFADYWNSYMTLLNQIMVEAGEEVDLTAALEAVTIGAEGVVYANETDVIAEINLTLTAEGETVEMPMSIAVRETEELTASEIYANMSVDSETIYYAVTAEQTASSFNTSVVVGVMDGETEETEGEFVFTVGGSDTEEGVAFNFVLNFTDGYDEVALAVDYTGTHALTDDDVTSWDGYLSAYTEVEGEAFALGMDTNLTLSAMPEGELLTLGENSLNLLEVGDAEMEQFAADAQVPLMQLLGTLMQDETIAALMSGVMG